MATKTLKVRLGVNSKQEQIEDPAFANVLCRVKEFPANSPSLKLAKAELGGEVVSQHDSILAEITFDPKTWLHGNHLVPASCKVLEISSNTGQAYDPFADIEEDPAF